MNFKAFQSKFLWYGLGYKLVLIPLVILILFKYVFLMQGLIFQVSVMEAAMAPMITGSIIAITHDLEPKLASLLVGIGIPLSFFTLGIWYFILA
jgi:malate permease and related proteins